MLAMAPENSKTGGGTAALPAVWQNKADFDARFVQFAKDVQAAVASITKSFTKSFSKSFSKHFPDLSESFAVLFDLSKLFSGLFGFGSILYHERNIMRKFRLDR
jgi:hypothetical protein